MKLFLAGLEAACRFLPIEKSRYVLASYAYMNSEIARRIPEFKMFLLDSGAYTFRKKSGNVDWDDYLDKYAKFVKENNVKYYFELDIDNIVGYANVLAMRKKLETETGRKCIPVWHVTRGFDEYVRMCKEYDYIALGSSTKYKHKENHLLLVHLLTIARRYDCKVHALGFTPKMMKRYDFYSVDSTTWDGYRYGVLYKFERGDIHKVKVPKGKGITREHKRVTYNNFTEYCKYQRHLDKGR